MKNLVIIGNQIGNVLDLSPRAVEALKTADRIICEHKVKFNELVKDLEISTTTDLISCYDIKDYSDMRPIADDLKNNKTVVMISDAGYPMISDFGLDIVKFLIDEGLDVEIIGGPSISSTAHVVAGLDGSNGNFVFQEFFRFGTDEIASAVLPLKDLDHNLVFVDYPNRFKETVGILHEVLGNRYAAFCIELTTPKSRIIRGTLKNLETYIRDKYDGKEMSTIVVSAHNWDPFIDKYSININNDRNNNG
jgi:16S rRNA (cytidine1402-2'-O)-methyltransferase